MQSRDERIKGWFRRPDNLIYNGPLDDAVWGRVTEISQNRDSGILAQSNFAVISKDLQQRFPESVVTEEYDHWIVGSLEMLRVNIQDEEAVEATLAWIGKLDSYPVADETDYDIRCMQACEAAWDEWLSWDVQKLCEEQGWERFLDESGAFAASDQDKASLQKLALEATRGEVDFDREEFIRSVRHWLGQEPYNSAEGAGQLPLNLEQGS